MKENLLIFNRGISRRNRLRRKNHLLIIVKIRMFMALAANYLTTILISPLTKKVILISMFFRIKPLRFRVNSQPYLSNNLNQYMVVLLNSQVSNGVNSLESSTLCTQTPMIIKVNQFKARTIKIKMNKLRQ